MDKQFIRTLCNHTFFEEVKPYLSKTILPDRADDLYDILVDAHNKYQRDITLDDLLVLYKIQNPTASQANKLSFELRVNAFRDTEPLQTDIAQDYIKTLFKQEQAKHIAAHALEIAQGNASSFTEIQSILAKVDNTSDVLDQYQTVSTDVDSLLHEDASISRWVFNIPEMARRIGGLGPGDMAIIFARPETGKTAKWVSLACAPGGWIEQGASVHSVINEEPARRTMLRAISANTGYTKDQFQHNLDALKLHWAQYRENLKFMDSVDFSIEMLDAYAKKYKPNILIADQLDKIKVDGSFARTDERLKAVYVGAREIAKRHNCAFVAISQCSAEGEGKSILSMDMLENSRTGKAAEADLIIGIGKAPMQADGQESPIRTLNILKNKISGWHGLIHVQLDPLLSRYTQ